MTSVAEVTARITADISDFTAGMRRAAQAAETLKRDTAGLRDTPIDANARPFIDAVDSANHHLDALQADALKPIIVRGTVTGLTNGINGATGAVNTLGASAGRTQKRLGGGLMGGLGKVAIVGGVAAMGVGMLAHQFGSLAGKAQESIAVSRTTDQIIKNTGGAAKVSSAQVADLAGALSAKSGMDDEAIQSGMNLLLTFQKVANAGTGQAAVFDRASAAAVDLAATGFTSVEGASKMLGKALNDPAKGLTALGRAGVKFTDAETKKIQALAKSGDLLGAQTLILDKVEGKVKGVAAAAASPMDKLAVMFENFQEAIGTGILPVVEQMGKVFAPILDQMAGPLSTVVNLVGGAFLGAMQALAPVLPVLAQAVGALGQAVGGVLATAITALVPVLTPVLQTVGQLAQQMGPLLQPLLVKVGALFQALMAAVAPLIPVLLDMVTNVFATGIPILMTLADAVLQVVQAFAPLLAAIAPLLPVNAQLLALLGGALTPVLQALVPVIGAVAAVLSQVLGRAIGLVMMSVGGLVAAFSLLAPFVLNEVVVPVVDGFVSMAEDVVGAAAAAFSWVPGLGDKLSAAQQAIGTFKDDATAGIAAAADEIGAKGTEIATSVGEAGRELLLQGPKAQAAGSAIGTSFAAGMQSSTGQVQAAATTVNTTTLDGIAKASAPALVLGAAAGGEFASGVSGAAGEAYSAGSTVGNSLADGLQSTIQSRAPGVASAAYAMGRAAAQAVKDGAKVSSPSKVTMQAGRGLAEGVIVGVQGMTGKAVSAAAALGARAAGAVSKALAARRSRIVQEAKFAAADAADAVAQARADLKGADSARAKAKAQRDLTRATWALRDAQAAAASAGRTFDANLTAGRSATAAGAVTGRSRAIAEARLAVGDARAQVAQARAALADAQGAAERAQASRDLTRALWALRDAQAAAARAGRDFDRGIADSANSALDKVKARAKAALDLIRHTAQSMRDFGSVTSLQMPDGAAPSLADVLGNMRGRLDAIRKFGRNLDALRKLGIRNDVLQQVISAGPVQGGAIAEAILAAGKQGVSQVNEAQAALMSASSTVGDVAGQSQYGLTGPQAKAISTTNVTISDGAVRITFGDGVKGSDRADIKRVVDRAVREALAAAAREGTR